MDVISDQRLRAIYYAASFLFIKKGYANTQVSQIAEEAGIATGSVYNLFAGKKAILHFVLLCTFDKQYLERDIALPVKEVEDTLFIKHLTDIAEDLFSQIDNIVNGAPAQSFADMLSSLFDCTASYQVAFNTINDNRLVLVEVHAVYRHYVDRLHKVVLNNFLHYMERGEVRQVELPELHIGNIIEGIIWWAMYLPYRTPHMKVPVSAAKQASLDILKHAYMTNP